MKAEMDTESPKRRFPRLKFEHVVWAFIGIALVFAYIWFSDWPLVYRGDSFHDRMVHRLVSIEQNHPRSWKIIDASLGKMDALGTKIVRYDSRSPQIKDYHRDYMERWPHIGGMVVGGKKQVIIRVSSFELWAIAAMLDGGENLDTTLLHEMVHVANDDTIKYTESRMDAEEQLMLCLDPAQRPEAWVMFERSLVDELVAYVASRSIIEGRSARVPVGRDITDPRYSYDRWYVERLDYLIPECFSRIFYKSVVGWSPHFPEEEADILKQRVEDFRNSGDLGNQVKAGLRKLRIEVQH